MKWKEIEKALKGKRIESVTGIVFHIGVDEEWIGRVELELEGGDRIAFQSDLKAMGEYNELWVTKNEARE